MSKGRARPNRRRSPHWVGPGVMILVAFLLLGGVLFLSRGSDADIAPVRGLEKGEPCTRFEDAVGKERMRAAPCTIVARTSTYLATVETSMGTIRIVMTTRLAPKSINNFIFLARAGFYDGTTFHRVENTDDHAIVQGGDPTGSGTGDAGYTFKEQATPQTRYIRGVVAMASRARSPGLNGSQFFIVVEDWEELIGANGLPTETFFGVIQPQDEESFGTLDKMITVPVDGTSPRTPITIKRVTVIDTSVPRPDASPSGE